MENNKVDHLVKQAQTPSDSQIQRALDLSPFAELGEEIMNKKNIRETKDKDKSSAVGGRARFLVGSAAAALLLAGGAFYLIQNSDSQTVDSPGESFADDGNSEAVKESRDLVFELPGKVVLEADSIQVEVAGETFTAPSASTVYPSLSSEDMTFDEQGQSFSDPIELSDWSEGTTYIEGEQDGDDHVFRTFEFGWREDDSLVNTWLALASNGSEWWVYMVWSSAHPDSIDFNNEWTQDNTVMKAKIGEAVTGDFEIPVTDSEGKEQGIVKFKNLKLSTPGFYEFPIEEYEERIPVEILSVDSVD